MTDAVLTRDDAARRIRAVEEAVGRVVVGQARGRAAGARLRARGGVTPCSRARRASARRCSCRRSRPRSASRFSRIQFTPDLLPADVTGTHDPGGRPRGAPLRVPARADLRAPRARRRGEPRDAAHAVRAARGHGRRGPSPSGRDRWSLPRPFCVLATQNPIEMEGTFPLPEAQLDRFLAKIVVLPPDEAALVEVFRRTRDAAPAVPSVTAPEGGVRRADRGGERRRDRGAAAAPGGAHRAGDRPTGRRGDGGRARQPAARRVARGRARPSAAWPARARCARVEGPSTRPTWRAG